MSEFYSSRANDFSCDCLSSFIIYLPWLEKLLLFKDLSKRPWKAIELRKYGIENRGGRKPRAKDSCSGSFKLSVTFYKNIDINGAEMQKNQCEAQRCLVPSS